MHIRDFAIRHLGSPYGLTAFSSLLFLTAYFFPPSLYAHFLAEPDYIFLDPASLLFFILCALAFIAGVVLVDRSFPTERLRTRARKTFLSPLAFLLFPLGITTAFALLSSLLLIHNNPDLILLLVAAQANELKLAGAIQVNGLTAQAAPLLMGVVWWVIWRKGELQLSRRGKRVVNLSILSACLVLVIASMLLVTRAELMIVLAGVMIVVLLVRLREGTLTSSFAIKAICISSGFVPLIFIVFSILRGVTNAEFLIGSFMGYTVSPYNRLAAMLGGILHYPFSGKGIYFSAFASFNNSFNAVFRLNRFLQWPDFDTVWRSEFDAVSAAGLDGRLIWSGTFGYIFADLGWFSPLLLFLYGLGTGWTWHSLQFGRVVGVVLYPWCAYCNLFWSGTNYLLDSKLADLLLVTIALYVYEGAFSRMELQLSPQFG